MAMILIEPAHTGTRASLGQTYLALRRLVFQRELALVNGAAFPVLLSFVGMYAALGPLLQEQFRLGHASVLLIRLAGLPVMLLAPVAGWLAGRYGATRVAVAGFLLAATGLVAEALLADSLPGLIIGSVIFVLGVTTIIPSVISLVGTRGGSSRAGALAINGLVVFAGASCGPLAAQLPMSFSGFLLALAALLTAAAGLAVLSSRPRAEAKV